MVPFYLLTFPSLHCFHWHSHPLGSDPLKHRESVYVRDLTINDLRKKKKTVGLMISFHILPLSARYFQEQVVATAFKDQVLYKI